MKKVAERAEVVSLEDSICTPKKRCSLWGKFWIIVGLVIIIIAGYYVWTVYQSQNRTQTEIDKANQEQILSIVSRVKRHLVLPDSELPQVAEIKDAALASKEQPFLNGSQNGDFLIVYAKAGKAIVYSPTRDLIVNVGPVQMGEPEQAAVVNDKSDITTTTPTKK